jgi:hypothetical protein
MGSYLLVKVEGSYHAIAPGEGSVPRVSRFLEEQPDLMLLAVFVSVQNAVSQWQ